MDLEHHVLDSMFEKSLFSDLSLAFYHSSFPFTMRFDVHKAIVAQSPFFRLLLDNAHRITTIDTGTSSSSSSSSSSRTQQQQQQQSTTLHLTIDLIDAMTRRGFVLTPSEHIIRRQWQQDETNGSSSQRHILTSHLRFGLKWLYSMNRCDLVKTLKEKDTLNVLCVAVLFELDELVQGCLERYTTEQLSIHSVMNDLEIICQLPRHHKAYHQLRDATLLLLLRYGPEHPTRLAQLSVDYMSDVLSVDMLYVGNEYERYCLLRQVLVAFMHSVGKITWTATGPVDQDFKRLSGFVRLDLFKQQQQPTKQLTASDVRLSCQKRKRIPSEELVSGIGDNNKDNNNDNEEDNDDEEKRHEKHQRLARLSFSACVPFKKLVADASSGGVIDKATILSYLLRTTVNYSNMTFDQLSIVRQDGIVDESIVFRALWQREALERLLYPFNYQQSQPLSNINTNTNTNNNNKTTTTMIPRFSKKEAMIQLDKDDAVDRQAALDEYFDVGDCNEQEKRRRILLGSPRFRFCASVDLDLPWNRDDNNGWDVVQVMDNQSRSTNYLSGTLSTNDPAETQSTIDISGTQSTNDHSLMNAFDDTNDDNDDDDDSIWACEEEELELDDTTQRLLDRAAPLSTPTPTTKTTTTTTTKHTIHDKVDTSRHQIYSKTVFSSPHEILGYWHTVRLEAQILPRSSLDETQDNTNVLVYKCELDRTPITTCPTTTDTCQTKFRYDIYCLNRHHADRDDRVDPEDRVLVPVSHVTGSDLSYTDKIILEVDSLESKSVVEIDMVVALEIYGFDKV